MPVGSTINVIPDLTLLTKCCHPLSATKHHFQAYYKSLSSYFPAFFLLPNGPFLTQQQNHPFTLKARASHPLLNTLQFSTSIRVKSTLFSTDCNASITLAHCGHAALAFQVVLGYAMPVPISASWPFALLSLYFIQASYADLLSKDDCPVTLPKLAYPITFTPSLPYGSS